METLLGAYDMVPLSMASSGGQTPIERLYRSIRQINTITVELLYVYRIAGNFRGVKYSLFSWVADLPENVPHKNVGVAYRSACNAVQGSSLGNEVKWNFYSQKSQFSS